MRMLFPVSLALSALAFGAAADEPVLRTRDVTFVSQKLSGPVEIGGVEDQGLITPVSLICTISDLGSLTDCQGYSAAGSDALPVRTALSLVRGWTVAPTGRHGQSVAGRKLRIDMTIDSGGARAL